MKILITGGTGFIGTHLAYLLAASGHTVSVWDPLPPGRLKLDERFLAPCRGSRSAYQELGTRIHWIKTTSTDYNRRLLRFIKRFQVVFHLGGSVGVDFCNQTSEYIRESVKNNTLFTADLGLTCAKCDVRIVYVTSLQTWLNAYMISKETGMDYLAYYGDRLGLDAYIVEATHIYGPGQRWYPAKKAVPAFIRALAEDQALQIENEGIAPLDLIYVSDFVEILAQIGLSFPRATRTSRKLQIGSGTEISVLEFARYLSKLMGKPDAPMEFSEKRAGEPPNPAEFRKIGTPPYQRFGIQPTPLDVGLKKTIEWVVGYPAP